MSLDRTLIVICNFLSSRRHPIFSSCGNISFFMFIPVQFLVIFGTQKLQVNSAIIQRTKHLLLGLVNISIVTFRCNVVSSIFIFLDIPTLQDEDTALPRNVAVRLSSDVAQYPRRAGSPSWLSPQEMRSFKISGSNSSK